MMHIKELVFIGCKEPFYSLENDIGFVLLTYRGIQSFKSISDLINATREKYRFVGKSSIKMELSSKTIESFDTMKDLQEYYVEYMI